MNRRLVIGLSLLGFVGAGTASALASAPAAVDGHHNEICVVIAQDASGSSTKDLCVTWPG